MDLEIIRTELGSAVVGDVLDRLGHRHRFLPPEVQPLDRSMTVAGWAMPVLIGDVFGEPAEPFGRLTEALDDLHQDDIYLARSGRLACAAWGELLTATARVRGAAGAVIDGYHRDTRGVLAQSWPVFSRGAYAQDAGARAAVLDFRVPIEIEGVAVTPGDLLVGDADGVVVVPAEVVPEVVEAALEKVRAEREVRREIEAGMTSTEAYRRYGVL
ncbi:RraA family protein [Pseudactinotalea suaedae]